MVKIHIPKSTAMILSLAAAAFPAAGRADIAAAFADVGYGARPVGMGGAYTALASDPYGVLFNPACLPDVRGWQVSTQVAKQFGLIPYMLSAGAKGFGSRAGAGIAGLASGDDAWRETTVLASFGWKLGNPDHSMHRMALGVTLKYRTVSFGDNADGGEDRIRGGATGFGLDFGLRWKLSSRWTLGMLLRDPWNRVRYDNRTRGVGYDESVPAALIIGTAYLPRPNLVFAFDADKAVDREAPDRFLAGAEWHLFGLFFLRSGMSQSLGVEPNRKWNAGLGIQYFHKTAGVRFDFAYQFHALANTPRVSVSVWL